jgi:hypothetical protein
VIPALFPVPLGVPAPVGWVLNSGKVAEACFPHEAGRVWINAIARSAACCGGRPIHSGSAIFNQTDLVDVASFSDHAMAPTVEGTVSMLLPAHNQRASVLVIATEGVKARKADLRPNLRPLCFKTNLRLK